MEEERLVASHCKENPKIFWKYVNSKRKICDHIGNLITDDKEGNTSKACTNSQKAEVLGNFFASVFVRETHYDPPNSQPRPCQSPFSDKCKMVSYYRKKSFDTQYHILHDDKIKY